MRVQPGPNQPQGPYTPYPPAGTPAAQPQQPWPGQPVMGGQPVYPPQGQPVMGGQPVPTPPQGQPFMGGQPMYTPEQLQQMQYEAYMQQAPQMPTMQQPAPEPSPKKKKKTPGKPGSGSAVWKIVIALVLVAGVAFFFLRNLFGETQIRTAAIEAGTKGNTHVGDALIVRNETAFDDEGVQNFVYFVV